MNRTNENLKVIRRNNNKQINREHNNEHKNNKQINHEHNNEHKYNEHKYNEHKYNEHKYNDHKYNDYKYNDHKHNNDYKYNKNKIAKSILTDEMQTNIIPNNIENPFTITLPSATGQTLDIGNLVIIIEQQASKFSSSTVSVFTKITKELSNDAHLIGIVQSIDAHNLMTASFGGLIDYPDTLKPAKKYYLYNGNLSEISIDEKQFRNRFMGMATSTNKILWNPESLHY